MAVDECFGSATQATRKTRWKKQKKNEAGKWRSIGVRIDVADAQLVESVDAEEQPLR